jgi:hypothetical protein
MKVLPLTCFTPRLVNYAGNLSRIAGINMLTMITKPRWLGAFFVVDATWV